MRAAAGTDRGQPLAAALIAGSLAGLAGLARLMGLMGLMGLIGLIGLAPAPARADGFPARSLGKPFFLADILTFPAGPGSLDVEVAWEIPVGELTFRAEHGYYRARYDISVVCRRGGRQIGGDVWERRVRLDTFAETRSTSELARGRQRFRLSAGDFEARVEIRDRQTNIASQVKGKVDGDPANLRIGLGDLGLVRYTGEGAQPNPDGMIRIGEPGHRARIKVRVSEGGQGVVVLEWRIVGPDGPAAEDDATIEVRGREAEVELPLDTAGFSPGRHRLEVGVKDGPGDPRTRELWLLLTAAWFVEHREETLEILGIVAPGELEALREGEGEAEWRRALKSFWQARDPDPSTPASEYRLDLQTRIEMASRFVEPFRRPGWRTDRGKVMLEHGEPPRRSVRPGSEDAPPSELWEYDEPRRQFLFVDLRGTGEFWLDR